MCRKNQLYGWMLLSFGFGVLIGLGMDAQFAGCCLGGGSIAAGFVIMRKRF